jgi:hypothetical protein
MTDITSVGTPIMSGFCAFPATHDSYGRQMSPKESCEKCPSYSVSPDGTMHPCPCLCHLGEQFECECGAPIFEALNLPLDEDGDEPYAHLVDGRADYSGCRG